MGKERSREGSMLAEKNVAGEIARSRRLSAFTNNLTALLALLVLGFPLTAATIRTTVAGWAIVAAASLQFVLGRIGPQLRLASIMTIRQQVSDLNQKD